MTSKSDPTGTIRVAVSGALGRMGSTTCAAVIDDPDLDLVAAIDPAYGVATESARTDQDQIPATATFADLRAALVRGGIDVAVDFSIPSSVKDNVMLCIGHGVPAGGMPLPNGDAKPVRRVLCQPPHGRLSVWRLWPDLRRERSLLRRHLCRHRCRLAALWSLRSSLPCHSKLL